VLFFIKKIQKSVSFFVNVQNIRYLCIVNHLTMTMDFTSPKDSIKNYSTSKIAKKETRDCVVRAFASAFEMDYDKSHKFIHDEFGRRDRSGTPNFIPTMNRFVQESKKIQRKGLKPVDIRETKTVGQFIKWYDRGTYIVLIAHHAFTIRDGQVVGGNSRDASRLRCRLRGVWKVS
jgi:hypothetical protein